MGRGQRKQANSANNLLYGRRQKGSGPKEFIPEPTALAINEDELHDLGGPELLRILHKLNEKADPPDKDWDEYHQIANHLNSLYDIHDIVEAEADLIEAILDMQEKINSNDPPCDL